MNAFGFAGSGTKTSWTINIGGAKTIDGTLAISQGGTGATTAAAARTALGLGTGDSPTFAGLTVTGSTSFSDIDIDNVGDIAVDSISGDGDADTTITFAGSDTINIAAGGSTIQSITTSGIDVTGTVTTDGIESSAGLSFTAADGIDISGKESIVIRIDSDDNDAGRVFQVLSGPSASQEVLIQASEDAGVSLYYDNASVISTTNTGIDVTGTATMTVSDNSNVLTLKSTDADENSGPRFALTRDSGSPADNDYVGLISFNADDDGGNVTRFSYMVTQIMDASNGSEDGALRLFTTSAGSEVETLSLVSGQVGIGTSSPDTMLHLSDAAGGSVIRLERNDTTIASTDVYGEIQFEGQDASAGSAAGIRGKILGVAEGATGEMALAFQTASGYGSSTERMRIDSSGNVGIGTSSPDTTLHLSAGNIGPVLRLECTDTAHVTDQAVGVIEFEHNDASGVPGVPVKLKPMQKTITALWAYVFIQVLVTLQMK